MSGTKLWQDTQPVIGSVSIVNFPDVQPVSIPGVVPVVGSLSVQNFPASQAVTGTFWPSAQPILGSVSASISNFPATQAVTGTFWQATQPVSGSISVSNLPASQPVVGSVSVVNFPASQAVTGTFFLSAQPVVGSVSVSGNISVSNFPSIQQVNGSVSVTNFPSVQTTLSSGTGLISGTVVANIGSGVMAVSGTFFQGTQPVSIASMPSTPVTGTFFQGTQPIIGSVSAIAITKGTQGAQGFTTQDLKDAGRTAIQFYAVNVATGATGVETLIQLSRASGTSAVVSTASYVITNGKTLRITSISVATRANAVATAQATTFNLRVLTLGSWSVNASPVTISLRSAAPATASAWDRVLLPLPDGIELAGNGVMQFGMTSNCTFVTNAPTLDVLITGFEY